MRRTPVLIAGGGPAGAAAAIMLAQHGIMPEVLERTREPHECVCGGFLSADTLAALRTLGLDPDELGARAITQMRVATRASSITVDLPFAAAGLSRRTLDAALLELAGRSGAAVRRGTSVRMAYPGSVAVRVNDDELILADALFLATGKHELRGAARSRTKVQSHSVGFRAELPRCAARDAELAGRIELHLFDQGYAGLLLQDGGSCNLCVSVSAERLARAGSIAALVRELRSEAPLLERRIAHDLPSKWEAVAGLPYGWTTSETRSGVFRIGDQAAVIASLAGDGLGIALTSGISAARALIDGGADAAPEWQSSFRRRARRPIVVGEMLRCMAAGRIPRGMLMTLAGIAPSLASCSARLTRIDRH